MINIPLPQGFDTAGRAEGEEFDVTATVTMTPEGLQVVAVDGVPVSDEPVEETADTEMDEAGFANAMGGGGMMGE